MNWGRIPPLSKEGDIFEVVENEGLGHGDKGVTSKVKQCHNMENGGCIFSGVVTIPPPLDILLQF